MNKEMIIRIQEHSSKAKGGLILRETCKVDCVDNLSRIMDCYPGFTVRDMSFFAWNEINIYIHREVL